MITPQALFESFRRHGVGLFAGVPDSLLASFCAYVEENCSPGEHVITANEGNAIALAAGYHLGTGKIGVVYLQNSGLGNTINPLTSITDPDVYAIPVVMVIGWRGEPGRTDEPQHVKQGRITQPQLDLLEIPYWILDEGSNVEKVVGQAIAAALARSGPVALLVRKGTLSGYKISGDRPALSSMTREAALRILLQLAGSRDLIVATTGKTSREVFEIRAAEGGSLREFLTVGGMGHTASIALGVALARPNRRVICLDGDGSVLMHLGAVPVIGGVQPGNFVHVVLNNAAHESVGGQPTVAGAIDFRAIAIASGYQHYAVACDEETLVGAWRDSVAHEGPVFLEVRVCIGSRSDLGRPTTTPMDNKRAFVEATRE